MRSFLNRSSPDESTFLESLVNSFTPAVLLTPTDIGCNKNTNYSMDIELIDPSSPLPLDLPFPTSPSMKIASQKIVDNWIQAGIAVPSIPELMVLDSLLLKNILTLKTLKKFKLGFKT